MSEVVHIPQLRFSEFSGDWTSKQLGEIAPNISYGLTVRPEYFDIGIPLISAKEIKGGYIDYTNAPKISNESFDKLSNKAKAAKGDIFLSKTGTIGRVAYVSSEKTIAITQNIAIIRTDNKVYSHQYIVQFLRTREFQKSAIKKVNQSTIMDLQLQDIKRLYICLPSRQEQQKIAAFLTSVDNKIEQLSKKKELLGEYKKGVMQQIFSQVIRFKADTPGQPLLPNGNSPSDSSDFPDWEEKKLGDIGQIVTGKTPSTNNPELWGGDISFITPTDITEQGKYQTKTQRTITKQRNTKLLPIGSIAYTCIASIGKMMITTNNSSTNQQINSIIVNDDFNNEFVYYALLKLTPYIKSTQANTTLPIINKTEFSGFKIQIPSLQEQAKIASFLSSIDNKIEQVGKQLNESKQFKKALLQQMFV